MRSMNNDFFVPYEDSYILLTFPPRYPKLMTDMSWDVLPKQLLLNYADKPIDSLLHHSHEDLNKEAAEHYDNDAATFLFNQTHVEELRKV